ncbi:hypothetical protein A2U01_0059054, partial [Trifolium medium]|nr:hypothetical protein [Trifolium medium]
AEHFQIAVKAEACQGRTSTGGTDKSEARKKVDLTVDTSPFSVNNGAVM